MKNITIFDLDETVIDSAHRTPNNPDGTLNLARYLELQNAENIFKDKLLPIVRLMRARFVAGDFVVILTARGMSAADYEFLESFYIPYHLILSRNDIPQDHYNLSDGAYKLRHVLPLLDLCKGCNVIMFEDSKAVKKELRKHFPVLCAHKINKKLSNGYLKMQQKYGRIENV